jgi:hypothetical protein
LPEFFRFLLVFNCIVHEENLEQSIKRITEKCDENNRKKIAACAAMNYNLFLQKQMQISAINEKNQSEKESKKRYIDHSETKTEVNSIENDSYSKTEEHLFFTDKVIYLNDF